MIDPAVSIVIVVGNQREQAARALASVLAQEGTEQAEVVLVDCARPVGPPLPGSDNPTVRVVMRPERGAFGAVRADAVRLARGPIIAFLEEHAEALPGWLAAIKNVLGSGDYLGASGEIHTANPGKGISDVVAVMNYSRWLPPLTHAWNTDLIVGHNAAYRTVDLLGLGTRLDMLLGSEVILQRELAGHGRQFRIDPSIRIRHSNETRTRDICRGYYLWNVSFGAGWSEAEQWSPLRRAAQVLGIPWWVIRRVGDMLRCTRGASQSTLVRHLPTVLVSQLAGALGIAVGCTLGERGEEERMTDYEVDTPRPRSRASSR
jgi:glycosyltransferase involved in cell wall biosynthesis